LPRYEVKLEAALREQSVPFMTEDEMKTEGRAKTPDVFLLSPVAVDGHLVHWIGAFFDYPSLLRTPSA
jgi:hypothetical protein